MHKTEENKIAIRFLFGEHVWNFPFNCEVFLETEI